MVKTFEQHFNNKFLSRVFDCPDLLDQEWEELDQSNKGVIPKKHAKAFLKSIEQLSKN